MSSKANKQFQKLVNERKKDHLTEFYGEVESHLEKISPPGISCGNCYSCCNDSHFNMVLHKPEYELIEKYIRENDINVRIHFEPLRGDHVDKRFGFRNWVCPLYSFDKRGCRVYPVRPLVCRLYGPYSHVDDVVPECSYKNSIKFRNNDEIEVWAEYKKVLRKYYNRRLGYLFTDSILYKKPALELLGGALYPWSFVFEYKGT